MKKIILLFLGLYFFSCNDKNSYVDDKNSYVDKARVIIKNNKNLDEVTNFYEKSPEKLKAAYILISNLEKGKSGFENTSMNKSFDLIVPVIKEKGKTPEVFELFNKYLDSLTHSRGNREYKRDVEIMDSDMLIDNIELAYRAVENLPKNLQPNEKEFLDYVLPYKNGFEPLEPNLRKNLLEEYGWIHSVIRKNNSLESGVCALLDTLDLKLSPNPLYSGTPTISQINKIKFGVCSDLVNLVVHILRALGIPATSDFTPHWGNHYSMGHEWLVFFSKENEYAIDVYDYRQLNNIYEYASLPKVFRKNFNSSFIYKDISCEDVTINYKKSKTSKVFIESERWTRNTDIGVFHLQGKWKMLNAPNKKVEKGFLFDDVGNEIIYVAESKNYLGLKKKAPFFLNKKNELVFLTPNYEKKVNAVITRKYPASHVRDNGWKESWVESLSNCRIMGANKDDLSDGVELYNLRDFATYNPITIDTKNTGFFKHYFLEGGEGNRTHVAEFYPLAKNRIQLDAKCQIIANDTLSLDEKFISDNNSLTFLDTYSLKIVFSFKKPEKVRYFKVQSRNDDNSVKPDNNYELLYWKDNDWKSLGEKVANDTVLFYENIPSNGVYWLRNHTEGKEEHVFLLDSLGKQYWPGVTNLTKKLENFWFCSQ